MQVLGHGRFLCGLQAKEDQGPAEPGSPGRTAQVFAPQGCRTASGCRGGRGEDKGDPHKGAVGDKGNQKEGDPGELGRTPHTLSPSPTRRRRIARHGSEPTCFPSHREARSEPWHKRAGRTAAASPLGRSSGSGTETLRRRWGGAVENGAARGGGAGSATRRPRRAAVSVCCAAAAASQGEGWSRGGAAAAPLPSAAASCPPLPPLPSAAFPPTAGRCALRRAELLTTGEGLRRTGCSHRRLSLYGS